MGELTQMELKITTAADGSATVDGPRSVMGWLYDIVVTIGTLTSGAADLTISTQGARGSQTILTLTNISADAHYKVRADTCGATGTALSANSEYPLFVGVPRVVCAQGGNVTTGYVTFYFFE